MMRVALNGRFTGTPKPTGTQTAARHLFGHILRAPAVCEFIVFADPRFPEVESWGKLPHVTLVETPFQSWSRGRAQMWEQFRLPGLVRRRRCNLVHHPINTSPALFTGAASVVTLHDLNFLGHPDWYPLKFRLIYSLCCLPGLHRARRVVTISNYVLGVVRERLSLPGDRLRMIYNGSIALPRPDGDPPGGPGRYIVCVGALPPHKNLARLIKAFLLLRKESPDLELRIIGRPVAQHASNPELPALLGMDGVRLLGYLTEAELAAAYAHAEAFCYPSLEEGFGLPLLEAMLLGCPVVTSQVSCLPEIAGPAATLVDPYEVEAIAAGLREVLALTADERARRIAQGREWAGRFSWERAAREYLDLYRELA